MVDLNDLRKQFKQEKSAAKNTPPAQQYTQPQSHSTAQPTPDSSQSAEYYFHRGECYIFGEEGFEKNLTKAFDEFYKAAHKGHTDSMNIVGCMYNKGEGCERDENAAYFWIAKAARNEDLHAMYNLYEILCDDKPDEAMEWLKRAAENGHEDAISKLQELRVDEIFRTEIDNLEKTLDLSTHSFNAHLAKIEKVIAEPGMLDITADMLRLVQSWLCFQYFDDHYLDDDFDKKESQYYEIIDKVDKFIGSMSSISDEAEYLYTMANMYSADRFKDIKPYAKLQELWKQINEIQLNDDEVILFKANYWEELAQETYDTMSTILKP